MNTPNNVISINAKRENQFFQDSLECLRLDLVSNYLNHKKISDYPELHEHLQEAARLIKAMNIVLDNTFDDEPF